MVRFKKECAAILLKSGRMDKKTKEALKSEAGKFYTACTKANGILAGSSESKMPYPIPFFQVHECEKLDTFEKYIERATDGDIENLKSCFHEHPLTEEMMKQIREQLSSIRSATSSGQFKNKRCRLSDSASQVG